MRSRSHSSPGSGGKPRSVGKKFRAWEKQYPDAWILLAVTEEANGEPVRGTLIATALDPEELQET